jgi:hypothetical protein
MKRYMLVARFVFAALAVVAIAIPLAAGEFVPFRGTLEGEEEVLTPPPHLSLQGIGGGNATKLGRYTYVFDAAVDFTGPMPVGLGTLTLTAANGDQVIALVVGTSTPIAPFVVFVEEEAVIVGGTGRFAGASGSFDITRLKYQDSGVTSGSFAGTISRVGKP